MAKSASRSASRGAGAARSRSGSRRDGVSPGAWVLIGAVPTVLFVGCLAFGLSTNIAAAALSVVLALALCIALALPGVRANLADIKGLWVAALLMAVVLLIAALSLTPFLPGGAHPIWEWAGTTARASTINRFQTTMEMLKLCGLASIFLVGALQGARTEWAQATVKAVLVVGGVYAAVSLIAFLTGAQIMPGNRLSGGFMSANSGGTVFGLLTLIALADTLRLRRRYRGDRSRLVAAVAPTAALTALFATCLLLTASRMGAAATATAAALFLVWNVFASRGGLSRAGLAVSAGVLLVGLYLMSGAGDLLWTRLDMVDQDAVVRQAILAEHWKAFLASPLFGYGLGSFVDLNSMIMTADSYGYLLVGSTHNVYLQWLEEAGVVGAAPMFALIAFIMVVSAWRAHGAQRGPETARGLVVAGVVILIHGLTDFALQEYSIAALWAFLLGLQFAWGARRG